MYLENHVEALKGKNISFAYGKRILKKKIDMISMVMSGNLNSSLSKIGKNSLSNINLNFSA